MSALQSALAELRSAATTSTLPHLPTPQSAALLEHIDQLTADLAEAREQVQAACCGPWHERETTEADAAAFPWQRVKAAREVASRWHDYAWDRLNRGPRDDATAGWAVASTALQLVLAELDYDGIEARDEQGTDPALAFADEDDAVHHARAGRATCGAPGVRRAECVASVTCRDCLDTFRPAAESGAAR